MVFTEHVGFSTDSFSSESLAYSDSVSLSWLSDSSEKLSFWEASFLADERGGSRIIVNNFIIFYKKLKKLLPLLSIK